MFSLGNHEDATVIGRQESACILLPLAFFLLLITVVACQRPPGESFPLPQQVDAQIGSHSIQPLAQVLAIPQLLPVQTDPQENLLRHISSIFLIAEQAINIGINWPPESLVELGEHLRIVRKE